MNYCKFSSLLLACADMFVARSLLKYIFLIFINNYDFLY